MSSDDHDIDSEEDNPGSSKEVKIILFVLCYISLVSCSMSIRYDLILCCDVLLHIKLVL